MVMSTQVNISQTLQGNISKWVTNWAPHLLVFELKRSLAEANAYSLRDRGPTGFGNLGKLPSLGLYFFTYKWRYPL